jgi:hypothetical protein
MDDANMEYFLFFSKFFGKKLITTPRFYSK